jgi:hypothetical protein
VRPLAKFYVEFRLALGQLDPAVAGPLVEHVESASDGQREPWLVARWSELPGQNWVVVGDPLAEAIRRMLAGEYGAVSARRRIVGERADEGLGVGRDSITGSSMRAAFELLVDGAYHEAMFVRLAELLRPRHAAYVPTFDVRFGWQGHALELALERDFGMHGDPEGDSAKLARTLAPFLPRLGYWMPTPAGLPGRLGWLNYWHPEVAEALGFPDPDKDARILPLSYRTESGAWVAKLTEEPLDLLRPDHVEALAWAYQRFDKIGKRKPLATRKAKPRAKRAPAAEPEGTRDFVVRERDERGQWRESGSKSVRATSADEALRVHFAKMVRSRAPKPGESLRKLKEAYDEMAGTVGMTMSADIDAVEAAQQQPGSTTAKSQTSGASAMPSHADREIASTALALWDMNAEDAESVEQLLERVADGLVDYGLDAERARDVARMADAALNSKGGDSASRDDFKADPVYAALLEEIEEGGWDV